MPCFRSGNCLSAQARRSCLIHYNGALILFCRRGTVACPFFMPQQRLDRDWRFPQRLPLGAGWSGTCTVPGHEGCQPSDDELKSCCNLGYARGCSRLPRERHADAVRFALGEECGGVLRVRYACELDYLPAGHGELLYETATGSWRERHPDARIQRMAECYVEVQLEKRASLPASD